MKRKILHVENAYKVSGALKALITLCDNFSGIEHIWLLNERSGIVKEMQGRFKVYTLPFLEIGKRISVLNYFPRLIRNCRKTLKIIRDEQIEIVHVNDLYNLLGVALKIASPKLKIVYHARLLRSSYLGVMYPFFSFFIRRFADRIICVSVAVQKDLQFPPQSRVIYNVRPEERLSPWDGLNDLPNMQVLYLGNYIKGKGQDLAIRALAIVHRQFPEIKIRFIGESNSAADKKFKASLFRLASKLNVADNISLDGPDYNVESLMKQADVILNLSESESFSMVCLEAMAFGIPLIVSDCGGPREITGDGEYGYLVNNRSYTGAAREIINIASDPAKAKSMGRSAQEFINQKFILADNRSELNSVFLELLNEVDNS